MFFALAINFQHVKGLMVESVDSSFVPWSYVTRAAGGPLAVQIINRGQSVEGESYLVSLYYSSLLIADKYYRHLSGWVGSRFPPCPPILSHSLVI